MASEITDVAAVAQRPFAAVFDERARVAAWKTLPSWAMVGTLLAGLNEADVVAAADHSGRPNPLLAAYRAASLSSAIVGLGPGDAASNLLGEVIAVVDLGEAGTLNVNQPDELERARRLTRPAP